MSRKLPDPRKLAQDLLELGRDLGETDPYSYAKARLVAARRASPFTVATYKYYDAAHLALRECAGRIDDVDMLLPQSEEVR